MRIFMKIHHRRSHPIWGVWGNAEGIKKRICDGCAMNRALQAGARSASNLSGGIFRWYNENNPLMTLEGETVAVHPFDEQWERLLRKRNKALR